MSLAPGPDGISGLPNAAPNLARPLGGILNVLGGGERGRRGDFFVTTVMPLRGPASDFASPVATLAALRPPVAAILEVLAAIGACLEVATDALAVVFFGTTGFFEDFWPPDVWGAFFDVGVGLFAGDFFGAGLVGGVFFGVLLVGGFLVAGFFAGALLTVFFGAALLDVDALEGVFFVGFLVTDGGTGLLDTCFLAGFLAGRAPDPDVFDDPDAFALCEAAFFLVGLEGVFFTTPGRSSQTRSTQTMSKQTMLACVH